MYHAFEPNSLFEKSYSCNISVKENVLIKYSSLVQIEPENASRVTKNNDSLYQLIAMIEFAIGYYLETSSRLHKKRKETKALHPSKIQFSPSNISHFGSPSDEK